MDFSADVFKFIQFLESHNIHCNNLTGLFGETLVDRADSRLAYFLKKVVLLYPLVKYLVSLGVHLLILH
jgi:hypothetical protein